MDDDADAPEQVPADDDSAGKHAGEVGGTPADVAAPPEGGGEHAAPTGGAAVPELTGHPAVDAVLASLEGLEESAVGEHVAVFENAHDALRRALNDAGEG